MFTKYNKILIDIASGKSLESIAESRQVSLATIYELKDQYLVNNIYINTIAMIRNLYLENREEEVLKKSKEFMEDDIISSMLIPALIKKCNFQLALDLFKRNKDKCVSKDRLFSLIKSEHILEDEKFLDKFSKRVIIPVVYLGLYLATNDLSQVKFIMNALETENTDELFCVQASLQDAFFDESANPVFLQLLDIKHERYHPEFIKRSLSEFEIDILNLIYYHYKEYPANVITNALREINEKYGMDERRKAIINGIQIKLKEKQKFFDPCEYIKIFDAKAKTLNRVI